ncbi:MAG: DUF1015 domain-containing protein [Bacteroidia bacterium]|nr:DUF1015 domain-containing protein [Bacteroidia bacterium]
MAEIIPFKGWRYNPAKTENVSEFFSPLSDVLNPSLLQTLYKNPHNSVHISIPQSQKEAVKKLKEWKTENIIVQENIAAIYILYQYFRLPNDNKWFVRKGFMAMVRLTPNEEDIIIHENTITASVQSRAHYLEESLMNVVPTHGLYEDNSFLLEEIMDLYIEKSVIYEYDDIQNVKNKFALITAPEVIDKFREVLKPQAIYLADGHHRLESSRMLQKQMMEKGELPEDSMINYHLMYLSNMSSDDLRILPTHRIWKPPIDAGIEKYLNQIEHYFSVSDISGSPTPLYEYLRDKPFSFGLLYKDFEILLELRKEIQPRFHISLPIPPEVKVLDYTVLHYFFFEKVACIPYNRQNVSPQIVYEKSYSQAIKAAGKGAYSFICREVSLAEMMSVCNAGAIMPPKTTFFYPKVVCGMVFASIEGVASETQKQK